MAALPALLCTILIFMDQQITAVIINRKEHKLKVRPAFMAYGGSIFCLVGQKTRVEDWIWTPLL